MAEQTAKPPQFDVFLLYNSREADRVAPIYSALVGRGLHPYFDKFDLPAGSNWSEYEEGILSRKPVIVLFLGAAGWGPSHRRLAIELPLRQFRIIPVIIGDVDEKTLNDAGEIFRRLKYISIDDGKGPGIDELVAAIRASMGPEKTGAGEPPPPRPPIAASNRAPNDVPLPRPPRGGAANRVSTGREKGGEERPSPPRPGKNAPDVAPIDDPPPAPPQGEGPAVTPPQKPRIELKIATRVVSEASEVDLLGFGDYADALADLIKNEQTEKPLTIGVEAPWGMGKTKLMKMIHQRLFTLDKSGKRTDMPTVWFDAWKYDKEESLWAALALEVMAQTRNQLSIWRWLTVWMELNWRRLDYAMVARSLLNAAIYCTLFVVVILLAYPVLTSYLSAAVAWAYIQKAGLVGSAAALLKVFYEVHKRLAVPFDEKISRYVKQPKYDERVGFIARFQADFKEIVKVITGTAAHPLVIFIDDLDRCTPVKAVEVLEAINLLLDSEHCVFVIGMDSKAVAASIEAKYKDVVAVMKASDDPGGLTLGERFLEKILQIEFRLPPPSPGYMVGYVDAILGYTRPQSVDSVAVKLEAMPVKEAIATEQEKGKSLDEAARSARLADVPEHVVREAKAERFAESFDSYSVVRTAVNSAALLLGNNPRKVKRFVNAFRLQALIANRRKLLEEDVIDLDLLAKWLVAATRWPELMSDILDDPKLLGRAAAARKLKLDYDNNPDNDNMRRLQAATEDPKVKRLAEAGDATQVIEELRRRAGNRLEDYLHLGRIVGEAKPQASAASA